MSKELDRDQVWKDFDEAVNMTPAALEKWLETDESRENGWKDDGGNEWPPLGPKDRRD